MSEELAPAVNLGALPLSAGSYTSLISTDLSQGNPVSAKDALHALVADIVPFSERLCAFIADRYGVDPAPKMAKAIIRAGSEAKKAGISSANLSQWFAEGRGEVYLGPGSVFKLCLALDLNLEEAARFVYDCLHQNWFSCRTPEGLVYLYCIGMQQVFGDRTAARAKEFLELADTADLSDAADLEDITGYTHILENGLRELLQANPSTPDKAAEMFRGYLVRHRRLLSGVKRGAIRTYRAYLTDGGVSLRPLTELYVQATGLALPETSYLDMTGVGSNYKTKRLLWGAVNRKAWLEQPGNSSDWDILNDEEIRLEHHAVERMMRTGVARGNIIALLFFHFCFDNRAALAAGPEVRTDLYRKFYNTTNMILADECGMMPLHPRKPFDRLFMQSMALSGEEDPIEYLNRLLERYYLV